MLTQGDSTARSTAPDGATDINTGGSPVVRPKPPLTLSPGVGGTSDNDSALTPATGLASYRS